MKKFTVVLSLMLVVVLALTACGGDTADDAGEAPAESEAIYTPGTVEKTAQGYGGDVVVEVTFSETEITDVVVTSHDESESIGTIAVDELPGAIVDEQTADVENVTGATLSSEAIKEAVSAAIDEAKIAE